MQWAAREFVARVAQLLNSASEAQPEPQATVGVGGSAAAQHSTHFRGVIDGCHQP
jgi:hypothetical protein